MYSMMLLKRALLCGLIFTIKSSAFGYTAADYTNAGLQLYSAKNYTQAIPYFTAALGMNPSDAKALQGRANSYYFLGRNQEALSDYEKILVATPSGPVSQFVQALRAKMGPNVPVAGAAASPSGPASANGAAAVVSAPLKPAGLGLRLEPVYGMVTFADFTADSETGKKDASQIQAGDPSYQFDSTVPSSYVMVGLEPVAQVGSSFEIGLPFTIMPIGTVTSSVKDDSGFNNSVSYALSAFSVGLTGRLLLGQGPMRVFVAAGGLMVPVGINFTDILNVPGSSTLSGSGSFSQSAFGGQCQVGLDFHVGEPFVVSLVGGYLFASANGFKGSLTTSGNGPTTKDQGELGVYDSPNGKKITFLKEGDPEPLNFRPLLVDLGGITAGIHLAVFF